MIDGPLQQVTCAASVFDFSVADVNGKDVPLTKFKNKKALLFVNVASE